MSGTIRCRRSPLRSRPSVQLATSWNSPAAPAGGRSGSRKPPISSQLSTPQPRPSTSTTTESGGPTWTTSLPAFLGQPQRTYDVVFFSFWLSHVPRHRFSAFWSLVHTCLAPSGACVCRRQSRPGPKRRVGRQLCDAGRTRSCCAPASRRKPVQRRRDLLRAPRTGITTGPRGLGLAVFSATPWFIFGQAQLRSPHSTDD